MSWNPVKAAERVFTLFSANRRGTVAWGLFLSPSLRVHRLALPNSGESAFVVRIPEGGDATGCSRSTCQASFRCNSSRQTVRERNPAPQRVISIQVTPTTSVLAHSASRPTARSTRIDFRPGCRKCLQTQGTRLYRMKGFLSFAGANDRIVIQGVHMGGRYQLRWGPWGRSSETNTNWSSLGREARSRPQSAPDSRPGRE